MADLLVTRIPLPVARPALEDPNGVDPDYWASTGDRMPLERPTEAADAFSEVGSYPPSGEGVKPLSEAPRGFQSLSDFLREEWSEIVNFYGWIDRNVIESDNFLVMIPKLALVAIVAAIAGYGIYNGGKWIWNKMGWKW